MLLTPGPIHLAVIKEDGTTDKTLILPAPDRKDGLVYEPQEKAITRELVDGSERKRRLGWLPVLRLKYAVYDDRTGEGYTIGTANGNRPSASDLLSLLGSALPGRLKVSLGPVPASPGTVPGFIVGSVKLPPSALVGRAFLGGWTLEFRGRDVMETAIPGNF